MKVILSRKGFDSVSGGWPSPIMPDGTMLSLPIPDESETSFPTYSDLVWGGEEYGKLLGQLTSRDFTGRRCHVDPDLGQARREEILGWKPAFGQWGGAQGTLRNAGVDKGDLFLFFGWFRSVEERSGGYGYVMGRKEAPWGLCGDVHAVFGYLQVGKVLTAQEEIGGYAWHPHASPTYRKRPNNTLYLPAETLSFAEDLPGYGTLDFREDRVLTMEGRSRSVWKDLSFLRPEGLVHAHRRNTAANGGICYRGQWQELVFEGTPAMMEWVRGILA